MIPKQIFDIFSKKKSKKKKFKPKIIVDHREKNSLVISELVSLGLEIEFKQLKVADYLVNDTAIERKTIFDFISSMKNKRLVNQLEEIQQYKSRLLIVEGIDEQELYSDSDERIGMHPNAIRGFLLSILLKYKVPIIFTQNYEDTAKFISVLSRKKEKEPSLNVTKKTFNKKELKQFIIESFPGIGPMTAKKLLKKFKTIKEIVDASQEELTETIGKKAEIFKLVYDKY
jgi:Fanconi anemia group M protein|tara:strand:- start:4697 stop:5383 length:687 start_codon:yes stop_codon:yes gene_type:complete